MNLAVGVLLLGQLGTPSPLSAQYSYQPRDALVLMVHSPKGRKTELSRTDYLSSAQLCLEKYSSLQLKSEEQAGVDTDALAACPADERLSCWTRLMHSSNRPWRKGDARFLLTLGIHPLDGAVRVSGLLLDLRSAHRELSERGIEIDAETLEASVYRHSRLIVPKIVSANEPGALQKYFEQLFSKQLSPMLEASGHNTPLAKVRLRGLVPFDMVRVGPKQFSASSRGELSIEALPPGIYPLGFSGNYQSPPEFVELKEAQEFLLQLSLRKKGMHSSRKLAAYVGGGIATLGAGLLVATIVNEQQQQTVCLSRNMGGCRRNYLRGELFSGGELELSSGSLEASPINWANSSSALLFSGLTLGGTSLWLGEASEHDWLPYGLAALAGVIGFGAVSLAQ